MLPYPCTIEVYEERMKASTAEENVIEVDRIEALEGTPVLDIKPFAPGIDSASDVKMPDWARPR
jgi:tRNA (adenine37-N6)-methyltransferase